MATTTVTGLLWPDILALVLYFVAVLGIGFWASCRAKQDSAQNYFLAGKVMTWIPIGASTFSTNVGAPMFIGLAGSAAATGIAVTMFEWHAMWMLLLLGWVFMPIYTAAGTMTMPGYIKRRFGGNVMRIYLSVLHLFVQIIQNISGQMYAGALFFERIFGWNMYLSVVVILGITALYTIVGGLTAVIWTDTLQTVVLIGGAFILTFISIGRVGGMESLFTQFKFSAANYTFLDQALYQNRSCGLPPDDYMHIFRPVDSGSYPWLGMIFGLTILATNAWCTDQIVVQRSLSAKNISHAKGGVILAAYLKFLSFFIFIIPGMVSRVLYPDEVACADPEKCQRICGNPSGCSNIAYPLLVNRILPQGFRGIMFAALLAALMSSLTSIFNSTSTVFTMDIWRRIRRRAKEQELMIVGRCCTLVMLAISIAWLPILNAVQGATLWSYSQSIVSYAYPPVVATFLLGMFWKRATKEGALAGFICGHVTGFIRMVIHFSHSAPQCGSKEPDPRPAVLAKVHYLHFAMINFTVSAVAMITVSCMTKPRNAKQLKRVTWWTRNDPDEPVLTDDEEEEDDDGKKDDLEINVDKITTGQKQKCLQRMNRILCGAPDKSAPKISKEEWEEIRKKNESLHEDLFWKKVLNINAVICAATCFFIHGFFA